MTAPEIVTNIPPTTHIKSPQYPADHEGGGAEGAGVTTVDHYMPS